MYRLMRDGARDAATLRRYLTEARGAHEAFRKGYQGIAPCLRLYPRGSIQAAACFAGREAARAAA
jgi:hypothetical protein